MKNFRVIFAVLCLLGAAAARADEGSSAADDAAYLSLVDKSLANPGATDWTALRNAYTKTAFYQPYGGMTLWPAFDDAGKTAAVDKNEGSIRIFQQMQKEQYANFKSHLESLKLARDFQPEFVNKDQEQQALEGIADSIVASGDGTTPDKAFKVITQEEENLVIETYYGSKIKRNQEATYQSHRFDVIFYEDAKTKKEAKAVFNIDAPYAHAMAAQNISGFK